ncbi:MAG: DVU0772 family protein [Thermodesulfobacteriota bacterium]
MLTLEDIKKNSEIVNAIDWDMTPEEAVRLYLEWGNNWARGNFVIRSKDDVSLYFVINTWREIPVIYLIRRNSEQADELAEINLPAKLKNRFLDSIGHNKGVYAIDDEIKIWLQSELDASGKN